MTSFFLGLAVEANLKGHIRHVLATKPRLKKRTFLQRPILDRALRPLPSTWRTCGVDSAMIKLLLAQGLDPNEEIIVYSQSEYAWSSVWALYLQHLYSAKTNKVRKHSSLIQDELEATKVMIENGAAADLRPWTVSTFSKPFSGTRLTPSYVFHEVFSPPDALCLDQLLSIHRPRPLRQVCSYLRRTILLWFYRDTRIVV